MARNLDLTALRAFVTVVEAGGVTRAAGLLNLTQSAVSMQLKRLEDGLGTRLLDRSGRGIRTTSAGDQLLSHARRMLELNDEALARLTGEVFEGEITLGVPHDIIYPAIPAVLNKLATHFPRLRVRLNSQPTRSLHREFASGRCDVILTTEAALGAGGETLVVLPLVWAGAVGGRAGHERPLPLAFCRNCIFRDATRDVLDRAGIAWTSVIDTESDRASEAAVAADLGVLATLDGTLPPLTERVPAAAGLPALPGQNINLYMATTLEAEVARVLRMLLRQQYGAMASGPAARVAAE